MDLRETYNRIAEDWHADHQQDDWWIEGTDTFAALFPPGARILDVGCGSGVKAKYLFEKGLKVTGIDFSEKLIEIAKKEVPEAEFHVMDMRDVASYPRMFDGIFAQASLLHIPREEIREVLAGLSAKLVDGGYLYAAVKGTRPGTPLEEMKEEHDYGYSYERFFSYHGAEELRSYFAQIGLAIVYESASVVGRTEWLQVIGKK